MTKMIIGLLAVVLGVTGSVLTAAPKKKQSLSATGFIFVKCDGDGYRAVAVNDYSSWNCNQANSYICAYYVTATGASTVTGTWYSNLDIANFAYGYDPKIKYVPNGVNEPYTGVYEEMIFE